MNRIILRVILAALFLCLSDRCYGDGFGWQIIRIKYDEVNHLFKNATPERKGRIIEELNNYFSEWLVKEAEMPFYKRMIDHAVTNAMSYDRLSAKEATALDLIMISLFSPESPTSEFEADPLGFYVPHYCMTDITNVSLESNSILPFLKNGRRFGTGNPVECASLLPGVPQSSPCYYTYLVLSPEEVTVLASELNAIKAQINFSYDDECFYTQFYQAINNASQNKDGLFLYTSD